MMWISLGENCLPENIIRRKGMRNISSPFSSCAGNLDYILQMERYGYDTLLNKKYLRRDSEGVITNSRFQCDDIYGSKNNDGVKFLHHDPINNQKDIDSFSRKIERLARLRESLENKIFLYHHRICENTDIEKLVKKSKQFLNFYKNSKFVIFHQSLGDGRGIAYNIYDNTMVFNFNTVEMWHGNDQNIFWAKCDDDLLDDMILEIKKNCV